MRVTIEVSGMRREACEGLRYHRTNLLNIEIRDPAYRNYPIVRDMNKYIDHSCTLSTLLNLRDKLGKIRPPTLSVYPWPGF